MGRKKKKAEADRQTKKVTVEVISREHAGRTTKLYALMDRLIKQHHPDLADAKIVIGWRFEKKEDGDGRLWLGSLKKAADVDRLLHEFDFVMMLNHEFCNKAATDEQIEALIDHELCHGAVVRDSHGEIKVDENERIVFRIRKHDVEEFSEIIARHGAWKKDLEVFFAAWKEARSQPLFADEKGTGKKKKRGQKFSEPAVKTDPAIPPGATSTTTPGGIARHDPDAVADKAATNGHAPAGSDWRKIGLGMLGKSLPASIHEALEKVGVGTFGDYDAYRAKHGAFGIQQIKNMGSERAEKLNELVEAYRDANPDVFKTKAAPK